MPDLNASHQLDAESVVPRPGDGDLSGSLPDPTHYRSRLVGTVGVVWGVFYGCSCPPVDAVG